MDRVTGTEITYFYFISYAIKDNTGGELTSFTTGRKSYPRGMSRYNFLMEVMGLVLVRVNSVRESRGLDSCDLSQMHVLAFGCDVDEMG